MNQVKKYNELEIYFQDVDHFDIKTIQGSVGLRQFISGMLSYYPWWIVTLYRIREVLVKLLDLVKHEKPEILPLITPEDLSFTPGENASFFIVRDAKEETYWVSETPEDRHLKAYFGVVVEKQSKNCSRFHVFTSVKYIHWTGSVYFNLIRPFHHLVVSRMMRAGVTPLTYKR
ncbi:MAG: DUF2867 domain-containing protein [Proteobacteria bacterium]|nr:DUF2867 domain-containing protein [Pseudomonadota bacterium]